MKVAIIGSGIIGVSTAYYLHKNGHEVSVYEQYAQPALGTTHANAGLLTPSFSAPWNTPGIFWTLLGQFIWPKPYMRFPLTSIPSHLFWGLKFLAQANPRRFNHNTQCLTELAMYSRDSMLSLLDELPISFEYEQTGLLLLFDKQNALKKYIKDVIALKSFIKDYEILNTSQTITKEPSVEKYASDMQGSLYFPTEAKGDAHLFTHNLAESLKKQGVAFYYNSVTHLQKSNKSKVSLIKNEKEISTDMIVLAAGPQSTKLAKGIGIKLPIKPCRGHSITLESGALKKTPSIPMIDYKSHTAMTPLGSKLRITSFAEFVGENLNINTSHIKRLIKYVNRVFEPQVQLTIDQVKPWAGLRPLTHDGMPIIGPSKFDNIWLNTGHGPGGWTLGLGSGKLLADLLSKQKPALNPNHFDINRF